MTVYALLDIVFLVFHTALVLFNLTGWIWQRTRRMHLLTLGLTVASWVGLGVFFGWGYCPCTDWHWRVKRALGEADLPNSYVKYYLDRISGMAWDPRRVDAAVVLVTLVVLGLSLWFNWRDWRSQKADASASGG